MKLIVPALAIITLAVLGAFMFIGSKDDTSQESSSGSSTSETYTINEVAMHDNQNDCWTTIEGSVYDLTGFIADHPGGEEILRVCGSDGTTLFGTRTTEDGEAIGTGRPHSSAAENELERLKIGELAN
jgi:hypothetical protein